MKTRNYCTKWIISLYLKKSRCCWMKIKIITVSRIMSYVAFMKPKSYVDRIVTNIKIHTFNTCISFFLQYVCSLCQWMDGSMFVVCAPYKLQTRPHNLLSAAFCYSFETTIIHTTMEMFLSWSFVLKTIVHTVCWYC